MSPETSVPVTEIFESGGTPCEAWFFSGAETVAAPPAGRPVVVMAHGVGGTKDSGLAAFATGLSAIGLHVLAFDYRGFGGSGGQPRQRVSPAAQVDDYRAAMGAAKGLPGADPDRLVLWGESLSGGLVIEAAAGRADVAAVISMVPVVDGLVTSLYAGSALPPRSVVGSTLAAGRAGLARLARRAPVTIPLAAAPGEVGALTAPGHREAYLAIAGPTWRNEVDATIAFEMPRFRPIRHARLMPCPWLVQIADFDRAAAPNNALRAAVKGRAEVRHYPCDHFDTQPGAAWHDTALAHQAAFLRRRLA